MPDSAAQRFERHRRRLVQLARGWLGSRAEAEDAVQDTWLRAADRLSDVPAPSRAVAHAVPDPVVVPQAAADPEAAWLVTVLRHLCIDRLRRRQLEQRESAVAALDSEARAPSAEDLAAASLQAQAELRRLARQLAPADLAALLLHAVFDYEHGEIARLAGQTEAAVRQRVHRALRRVRPGVTHMERAGRGERDAAAGIQAEEADEAIVAPHEALFSLCWRALRLHDAAGLVAQLVHLPGAPSMPAAGAGLSLPRGSQARPATAPRVPAAPAVPARAAAVLMHVDGAYALAWVLDGVVLCTLPLGPLDVAGGDDRAIPAVA